MLPVFRGAPHAPRGTHDEQSCLELGRSGLSNAKTQPDPTARRMTLLRIMQQIQSIDRESREQPNFSHCVIRMWKGGCHKDSCNAGKRFTAKRFFGSRYVEKFKDYFFARGFAAPAGAACPVSSASLASSASTRVASWMLSSLALTAISRTASNSSRCTTSMEFSMRSACARNAVSTSRRTPCAAPAASVMIFANSSRMRFGPVAMADPRFVVLT
ncbi:hypothetical protein MPL3365_90093 [Mesorhizobium plurifarium]|uniref:Uncharacterized protein n=1 Tax=Mesorhizobium plurifarium TaxID=69974 RepID=A0A090GDY4_MESPL|nr:hypothetical protein MPL3365_90093 [Mesorhizobium plurifarium]